MAELPAGPKEGLKGLGTLISFAGPPNSGENGRPIYFKDPQKVKYYQDGKLRTGPLEFGERDKVESFVVYGKTPQDQWAGEQTGIKSARIHALVGTPKDPHYEDVAFPIRQAGEEFPWQRVGAVSFMDAQGRKIYIPRDELSLENPKEKPAAGTAPQRQPLNPPGHDAALHSDMGEEPEEIQAAPVKPVKVQKKPTKAEVPPATRPTRPTKEAPPGTPAGEVFPRYVDGASVTRDQLRADARFQTVLVQAREVLREIKKLKGELDDLKVLPELAEQVREVGKYSRPEMATNPQYETLVAALTKRGLNHDEFLLATDYLADEAKRAANELRLETWSKTFQQKYGADATRQSILDMVERDTEGSVQFSRQAVEMNMTAEDRAAGYQDLRATQLVSDYLLDTYDPTARAAWVADNRMTAQGIAARQQYQQLLSQMMRGDVPAASMELVEKLRAKYEEFKRLSPQQAVEQYRGLVTGDRDRLVKSVERWRKQHNVEPYRPGELDFLLTKGLALAIRRADYPPQLHETSDLFYRKALKEKQGQAIAGQVAAETAAAAPAGPLPGETPVTVASVVAPAPGTGPTTGETPAPGAPLPTREQPQPPQPATPAEQPQPEAAQPAPPALEPQPQAQPVTELRGAVVATKGSKKTEVTSRNWFGREEKKTLADQELIETQGNWFARLMMTEPRRKWDPRELANRPRLERWGQQAATLAERAWKGTFAELPHFIKEKRHGIKLFAATGLEGRFSWQFFEEIDKRARTALDAKRGGKSWIGKTWDNLRDFGDELFARERDLHRKRVEVAKDLRAQFDQNPMDAGNPMFKARWGDYYAQDAVASRIADTTNTDALHVAQGEKRTGADVLLEKGTSPRKFINEQILTPVIGHGLNSDEPLPAKLEVELRTKLTDYFLSDEFQQWRSDLATKNPDAASQLDLSLSYASNIIDVAKDVLLPNVRAARSHWQGVENLDLDIKLTLGTARFGPNGEIPSRMWGEKRLELSERVWRKLKERTEKPADLFSEATQQRSYRGQMLLALTREAVGTEFGWGLAAYIGSRFATAGLRVAATPAARIAGAFTPVAATGVAAGLASFIKEFAKLRTMREELNVEEALGYKRPQDAARNAELAKFSYQRVDMASRVRTIQTLVEKPNLTGGDALQLLGLVADTDARSVLGMARNINLWTVTNAEDAIAATGVADPARALALLRQENFQGAIAAIDRARAEAKTKLQTVLSASPALKQEITDALHYPANTDVTTILTDLVQAQTLQLDQGTRVRTELQAALGGVALASEAEAASRRDAAFYKWRWGRAAKHGAAVGGAAALFTLGTQELVFPLLKTAGHLAETGKFEWQAGAVTKLVTEQGVAAPGAGVGHEGPRPAGEGPKGVPAGEVGKAGGPPVHVPDLKPILDDAGNPHYIEASLPPGAQLVHRAGDMYELVYNGKIIAEKLIFDPKTGQLTHLHDVQGQLHAAGWDAKDLLKETFDRSTPGTSPGGDLTWHARDWDDRGSWGYITDKLKGEGFSHPNAATNAVKNILRGWERSFTEVTGDHNGDGVPDNMQIEQIPEAHRIIHYVDTPGGREVDWWHIPGTQGSGGGDTAIVVPKALFSDTNMALIGNMTETGAKLFETLHASHPDWTTQQILDEIGKTDKLTALLTKIGYVAGENNIPSRDEIQYIIDNLGGGPGGKESVGLHMTEFMRVAAGPGGGPEVPPVAPPLPPEGFWDTALGAIPGGGYHRPLEAPTPGQTVPSGGGQEQYPYGYGYYGSGYYGGRRTRDVLTGLAGQPSVEDQTIQLLPQLLPAAYTQYNITDDEQQRIDGLTPPEQLAWLQQLVPLPPQNPTPTVPQPVSPPPSPAPGTAAGANTLQQLASALNVPLPPSPAPLPTPAPTARAPIPRPPTASNAGGALEQDLTMYIADETASPVAEEDRGRAVADAQRFMSVADLEAAETQGGLNKNQSAALYKDMMTWLASQNAIDIAKDDPSFNQTAYRQVQKVAKSFLWEDDPTEEKRLTNATMRFLTQFDSKYHILDKGNVDANLIVVLTAYDFIRNVKFKSS